MQSPEQKNWNAFSNDGDAADDGDDADDDDSFDILKAAKSKKPKLTTENESLYDLYGPLLHVVPTSCDVERLFSQCKLVLTDHRRSMLPKTFEQVMMLKINASLWTIETVAEVCFHNLKANMERGDDALVVIDWIIIIIIIIYFYLTN